VFSRRFVPTAGGTLLSTLFVGFLANGFQLIFLPSSIVRSINFPV